MDSEKVELRLMLRRSICMGDGSFAGWQYATVDVDVEIPVHVESTSLWEVIGAEYLMEERKND